MDFETRNNCIADNQTNLSGDNDYLITDGLQVKVSGPPEGVKDWSIPKGHEDLHGLLCSWI